MPKPAISVGHQAAFNNIGRWGCYFLSLIYLVRPTTTPDEIVVVYHQCLRKGSMRKNCYVLDPIRIMQTVCELDGSTSPYRQVSHVSTRPKGRHIAVYKQNIEQHFVVMDGDDIVFDPLGPESGVSTIVDGASPVSFRSFTA